MEIDEDGRVWREKDLSQESMLYIAAAYDSPDALTLSLDMSADPNIKGGFYYTAVQAAYDGVANPPLYSCSTAVLELIFAAASGEAH